MGGDSPKTETSPFEYALADMAREKYDFEKNNIEPLSKILIRRNAAERTPYMQHRAEGRGITGAMAQATPQAQQAENQMLTSGLAPNSGSFIAREGALGMGKAVAGAQGGAEGVWGQDNRYIKGLQNLTAIGTKKAAQAQNGMSEAAKQLGAQNSAEAQQKSAENAQTQSAVGTGVGIALTVAAIA